MDVLTRRRLGLLVGLFAYIGALWLLWDTRIIYPLKIFVVFLHEVSHGIAAVAGGGSIAGIQISSNQGGVCQCGGGIRFVTLTAGYLGSLSWGVAMLLVVRAKRIWHLVMLVGLGVLVLTVSLMYIDGGFGVTFGLLFGLALLGIAKYFPSDMHTMTLTVTGRTSGLYAVGAITSDVIDRPGIRSDASMLADLTGVPTVLWGVLWIGISLAVCWWLLRRTFRNAL